MGNKISIPFHSEHTVYSSHTPPLKIVAHLSHISNKNLYYFHFKGEQKRCCTNNETNSVQWCFTSLVVLCFGVFCGLAEEDFKNRHILLMYIFLTDTLDRTYIHRAKKTEKENCLLMLNILLTKHQGIIYYFLVYTEVYANIISYRNQPLVVPQLKVEMSRSWIPAWVHFLKNP